MTEDTWFNIGTEALTFEIASDAQDSRWRSSESRPRFSIESDYWMMSLAIEQVRDLTVRSSRQRGVVHRTEDGSLLVTYNRFIADTGKSIDFDFEILISANDGEITFSATGTMATEGLVNDVSLPILDLDWSSDSESSRDALYRPLGLGQRISDPWNALMRAHTEYFAADQETVWMNSAYPGEFSMAWQGLEAGNHFLYLGRHDPDFRSVIFSAGVAPRGSKRRLLLSVASLPMCQSGDEFSVADSVVELLDGDWRAGAHKYRDWTQTWYTGPPKPRAFSGTDGWQRIIMRHQYGEIYFRYDDLVSVFKKGLEHGIRMVLLFGWWRAGFDRGYPEYRPDEELGGSQKLREAIAEIERLGGIVALYANGNLIDRNGTFYKDTPDGHAASRKDPNGLEYVVGYNFTSESRSLRHFAGPDFVMACHGSRLWRRTMTDVASDNLQFGTSWLFFDQTAYHQIAWPCSDIRHDHESRSDDEARYRALTLDAIRAEGSDVVLGSEGVADCMISHLDYHHGWGFAFQDEPEAFPFLLREVFPEPVVSHRLIHDLRDDWDRQLTWAFVFNLVFDVAIYRCRADIEEFPEYAEKIGELTNLRQEYREFFEDGIFEAPDQSWDGSGIVRARYVIGQDALDILWNASNVERLDPDTGKAIAPNGLSIRCSR